MDRFKRILVAASPGQLHPMTVHTAIALAQRNDAHLTLLDVVPPTPRLRNVLQAGDRAVDVQAVLMQHRHEMLRRLAENTGAAPDTEVTVLVGEPFIEVVRHVLKHDNDLLVVGGREVEKGTLPTFSSGVMHLLRKCPVPVWVMRPTRTEHLRILALVDPDPDDPVRNSLNGLVLDLATSLARRENAELHVGHAWRLAGEEALRSSPYVALPGDVVDGLVSTVGVAHRERLAELLQRKQVDPGSTTAHLVGGDPGRVLPALAEQLDAGLIVMGTVARTGIAGVIIGNTAETILGSVRCSVLAVKPAGFVSPISPT